MRNFIVYNSKGEILRTGLSQDIDFYVQAQDGEFVMEGQADSLTQKVIINHNLAGIVVNKTVEELEKDKPAPTPEMPRGKRPAHITNEQWQDVLRRLDKLG